jgi:hypothetical protein
MTISVLHRPISSVEEDNPRRNAFERMLLFALFMKREKEEKKKERKQKNPDMISCRGVSPNQPTEFPRRAVSRHRPMHACKSPVLPAV